MDSLSHWIRRVGLCALFAVAFVSHGRAEKRWITDPRIEAAVVAQVQGLFGAVRSGDESRFLGGFDFHGMVERAENRLSVGFGPEADRIRLRGSSARELARDLFAEMRALEWTSSEVLELQQGSEEGQVFATVRVRDAIRVWWKVGLLLTPTDGNWRIVDFKNHDELTWTSVALVLEAEGLSKSAELAQFRGQLNRALELWDDSDYRGMLGVLDTTPLTGLAPCFGALHGLLEVWGYYGVGENTAALVACERALALDPHEPALDWFHAELLLEVGQFKQALAVSKRNVRVVGADRETREHLGRALAGLGRRGEAERQFALGIADDPESVACLIGWGRVLPAERAAEVRAAYRRLGNPEHFERIVCDWLAAGRTEVVEALIEEQRGLTPSDSNIDYYQAEVLAGRGDLERARALFLKASRGFQDDSDRRASVEKFLDACVDGHASSHGLAEAPNRYEAFEYLAGELARRGAFSELRTLVDEEARTAPRDPSLSYFQAQLSLHSDDSAAALGHYEVGYREAESSAARERYRWNGVALLCSLGRGAEAYGRFKPKLDTFDQVAAWAVNADDSATLKAVMGHLRKDRPGAQRLKLLEGVLLFMEGEYEAAFRSLEPQRLDFPENGALLGHVERALIFSALELGYSKAAVRDARRSTLRDGNAWFEVVVYTWLGEVEEALRALNACIDLGISPAVFYSDRQMGPILLEDARFARFRTQFPPHDWIRD